MPLDQIEEIKYNDEDSSGKEMTFLEHLEELRWHIIRSLVVIVVFMVLAFFNINEIYNYIILGPSKPDFWTYRMLCNIGDTFGWDGMCVKDLNFKLISLEVSGQFMMALTSSAIIGLVVAFPYVFWEFWSFIKPGLKKQEIQAARGGVFYVTLLFFLGVLFGYFVVSPFAIKFLVGYQIDPSILNQFAISSYISILATLTLACGVTFQLPMIFYVLTKIGIVNSDFLKTYRKHAIIILLVIAAVITPSPDAISQILVFIPLYFLYEISILISKRVEKKSEENASI